VSTTPAINDNYFEIRSLFIFCLDTFLLHSYNDFLLILHFERGGQADFFASFSSLV
jgi:hypothetical protein